MLLVGGQPDARVRDEFTCTVSQLGDLAGQWLEATGTTSDWVVRPLQLSKDAAQVRPRSGDSRGCSGENAGSLTVGCDRKLDYVRPQLQRAEGPIRGGRAHCR